MRRIDLFGLFDLIAIRDTQLIGVQTTSMGCASDHHKKIVESDAALPWVLTGSALWLVCWRQLKVKNKNGEWSKRKLWAPHAREYTASSLERGEAVVIRS